jgi:hypothetical protein
LRSAGIPVHTEPTGLSRQDGKHPDGQSLVPWKCGKPLVWDYTVRDTYAPTYLPQTSITPGAAAALGATTKLRKYAHLLTDNIFIPIAVETTGVWAPDSLRLLRDIGSHLSATSGEPRATLFFLQRISISIQRGNAASILGTLPSGRQFHEMFLL